MNSSSSAPNVKKRFTSKQRQHVMYLRQANKDKSLMWYIRWHWHSTFYSNRLPAPKINTNNINVYRSDDDGDAAKNTKTTTNIFSLDLLFSFFLFKNKLFRFSFFFFFGCVLFRTSAFHSPIHSEWIFFFIWSDVRSIDVTFWHSEHKQYVVHTEKIPFPETHYVRLDV